MLHRFSQYLDSKYSLQYLYTPFPKTEEELWKRLTKNHGDSWKLSQFVICSCWCYFFCRMSLFCRMSQWVICSSRRHAVLREPCVWSAVWLKSCMLEEFGVGAACVSIERISVCYLYCSDSAAAVLRIMFLFHSSKVSCCTANSLFRRKHYCWQEPAVWKEVSIEVLKTLLSIWSCCCCEFPGSGGINRWLVSIKMHQALETLL